MAKTAKLRPPGRYMTVPEVAGELGYKSDSPVYRLMDKGLLQWVSVSPTNSTRRVLRSSFEEFCARREAEAKARMTGQRTA